MGEPIEQGAGQPFRAKNLSPFLERQVRCHHRCTAFVSLAEHLEEQLGAGLGQRHEAQFIDDEQFVAGDLLLEAKQLLVVASLDQFANQSGGGSKAHAVATLAGSQSQGQGDMRFARAAVAQ